jgi:Mg-chelatase subunit ChlD
MVELRGQKMHSAAQTMDPEIIRAAARVARGINLILKSPDASGSMAGQ